MSDQSKKNINKICKTCGKTKDILDFSKNSKNKDGLRYSCKDCEKEKAKKYYRQNKRRIKEKVQKWQGDNAEKVRGYKRDYYRRSKDSEAAETKKEDEKRDNSPYVHQRGKIKHAVDIKELDWTDNQRRFLEIAGNKNMRVMLVTGPAGTSKTLISTYAALTLLNARKVSDICYLRSAVESSDSRLGFLPGTAEEKLSIYNVPFWDKVGELLPTDQVKSLTDDQRLHCLPINYIRGLNWNAKAIILDEAQNSTQKELVTTLTRLGHFTRCFILADPVQTDLNGRAGGFQKLYNVFDNDAEAEEMGIYTFKFTEEDIVRSELVKFIVKRLDEKLK
jgi:phosphate starvation-inducible protein PhoH